MPDHHLGCATGKKSYAHSSSSEKSISWQVGWRCIQQHDSSCWSEAQWLATCQPFEQMPALPLRALPITKHHQQELCREEWMGGGVAEEKRKEEKRWDRFVLSGTGWCGAGGDHFGECAGMMETTGGRCDFSSALTVAGLCFWFLNNKNNKKRACPGCTFLNVQW